MAIRQFQGPHRFLSNFYGLDKDHVPLAIEFEGLIFPTVEHAYVAAKVTSQALREEIRSLPTPGKAKRFLRDHRDRGLREPHNWRSIGLAIMENLVRQKFSNPRLAEMLLATDDEELIEGNDWGDTFWGVDLTTGQGLNHLGRILMKVRAELFAAKTGNP